jgi:hypothetical protein
MSTKINTILEEIDSLSLEEQEAIMDIGRKRLIERKRAALVKNVKEAEEEFASGKLTCESVNDIMKAIDYEADKNK